MNYQQTPHRSQEQIIEFNTNNFASHSLELGHFRHQPHKLNRNVHINPTAMTISKNQNFKINKNAIKISRRVENALPENFFALSKTQKIKKEQSPNRNLTISTKYFSKQIISTSQMNLPLHLMQCQSAQLSINRATQNPSIDRKQKVIQVNRFKVKKINSCRTSMEKNHGLMSPHKKSKELNLPKTAQTIQNGSEDDLFNITFGIDGFSTKDGPKEQFNSLNSIYRSRDQSQKQGVGLSSDGHIKNQPEHVNNFSLELRHKFIDINANKMVRRKNKQKRTILTERRELSNPYKQKLIGSRYQRFQNQLTGNPFCKIKVDMEEILKKKTFILPQMRHLMNLPQMRHIMNGSSGEHKRTQKLVKLIF